MRAVLTIAATVALLLGTIWLVRLDLAPLPPDVPPPAQMPGNR